MAITLTKDGVTLDLGERLQWTNAHAWQPVAQAHDRGTLGALMVHVRALQAGMPIDLDGFDSRAWQSSATVVQLASWAARPGAQFALQLRGQAHTVMFDHSRAPAFEARDLWGGLFDSAYADPSIDWLVRLKLIEI